MKFFRTYICVVMVLFGCVNQENEKKCYEKNPFYELLETFAILEDSSNSFEIFEAKISQIKPVACTVDEVKITQKEMDFLIKSFSLSCAVTLKKGEKAIALAKDLEKKLASEKIDIEKLSNLLDIDLNVIIYCDIPSAYILTNNPEQVIETCQNAMQKYDKDSFEYVMIRFALGTAFFKSYQPHLALQPTLDGYEYFVKNDLKNFTAIAASNLSFIYKDLDDEKNAQKYHLLAEQLANITNSDMIKCETALNSLHSYCDSLNFSEFQKKEVEENINFVLKKSSSDLQIWSTYVFSSIFKSGNNYDDEEILSDIEKAYMYRAMIWGDGQVGQAMKEIDDKLQQMRTDLLQKLADSKQTERLNYWITQFEKSRQRQTALESFTQINVNQELIPLLELVSRYENATQIIATESAKPFTDHDKGLIAKATVIKRQLEKDFDEAKNHLKPEDRDRLSELLADNFIIHPDSLSQLSSVIPSEVACLQFLLLGDNIIAYIVAKDTPPFMTIISLKKYKSSEKDFIKSLLKLRSLLQSKAPVQVLNAQLNGIYNILFSEIEYSLKKLGIKKLVINSSGILRYIPFAAVFDGKEYLVQKYQVTNVTGIDLIRLSKSFVPRQMEQTSIAVFADPDGTLPQSRKEGESVISLFSITNLFVGDKATLNEFESLLGNVNFIHLATHAVLDPNNPGKSFIQFADGKKWYYADMMGFNVKNVDSIALSACSTAISEKSTGGEIEGMAYQLLRKSPSGSVIASYWKVDDSATAILMSIYYKHIVDSIQKANILDRGGALREAQLTLLNNPDTVSPYYWAAFTLFGDFR